MTISATTSTVNGLLRIHGSDAEKFLQGQVTCDIQELRLDKALPGAFCNPQGRVRANFVIFQLATDDFLMILPRQQVSFLIDAMAPYVAFFKCTMTDSSDDWYFFGLQIDQVADVSTLDNMPDLADTTWEVSTTEAMCCIRLPGSSSRWLCLSKQPVENTIANISKMDSRDWQQQDMLSGLVWVDEVSRDKFLPHDLSLPALGAVSFTKGCYTGQEIVARMQYRGEPKYLLAIITTEPMTEEISDKLIQVIDNSEQLKVGKSIEKLHLADNRWLISASVKRTLLNQQQFQLLFKERSILCDIEIPDTVKETNNS